MSHREPQQKRMMCLPLLAILLAAPLYACGAPGATLRADLPALEIPGAQVMDHSPFVRDRTGGITEEDLVRILDMPTFLADETRLGIVPVTVAYQMDNEIPLIGVPEVLGEALEDTNFFEVTSEVSTDWPSDRSIAGLREIAARYRTRYLLLYRHRFVERTGPNPWAATYATLVTIPFVPGRRLETAGVLEATLFDVRTGTILFTVYERVHNESYENVWANERKLRDMRAALLDEGAERLADKVVSRVHRLVASRPTNYREMIGTR